MTLSTAPNFFSYKLSYFRPQEPSTIDIILNPPQAEINGFQLVFQISSNPSVTILDQDSNLPGIQLDISNDPRLSFLTNRVKATDTGYQIELAAITSSPNQPLTLSQDITVAKLVFTQPSTGQLNLIQNGQLTKIATTSTAGQPSTVPNSTTTELPTQITGQRVSRLNGKTYLPATPQASPTPTPTSTTAKPPEAPLKPNTPVIVAVTSASLGLVALIYTLRQLRRS